MNEQKIEGLWWKARIGYNNQQVDPEVLAKFAELIVQECCSTIERQYKYSNGTPVSFWEMSQNVQDLLKKHFGVENGVDNG